MSESEDPRGAEFIQASVERDQPRVIDATRLTSSEPGQPPYPGAERVLKVTVPVDPEITADCKLHLPIDLDRSEEIDIDPCGYIDPGEIYDDEYLQQLLVQTPDVDGPRVAGTDRQLLNIDLPMLMKLFDTPAAPDITLPERERFRQLRELIDTHERDHATAGSHAHTLINPQTRSLEVWGNMDILKFSEDTAVELPMRSVIYNELCAMVAERSKQPDITSRLAIDRYRLQNGNPEYKHALSILKWLRNGSAHERLSYEQITNLLIEAGKCPHPIAYVTHALYDLANGMPLDDVIYSGTYSQQIKSYKKIQEQANNVRKVGSDNRNEGFSKYYSTVESVCIEWGKQAVIKEWWMKDPHRDISPLPIRKILLNRLIANYTENVLERRFMPTTLPKQGVRGSARQAELAAGMRFQDPRSNLQHPYKLAMAGNDDCLDATNVPSDDQYTPYHKHVTAKFINWSNWFDDVEQLGAWLEGSLFPR